jgi:hypothetical protein
MSDGKNHLFLKGTFENRKSVKHVVFSRFLLKMSDLGAGRKWRKLRQVQCFERFAKTGDIENVVIYEVSVDYGGFGADVWEPGASPPRGD